MRQDVRGDRVVHETTLDAAGIGVAHHVGRVVIQLHFLEHAALLHGFDKSRAHLHTNRHAFHVGERLVFLVVALQHHQALSVAVDGLGKAHDLLALRRDEHGGRHDVDTL
ncbi:hypothetical protein D3C87_1656140 [compost metagenome]